MKNDDNNYNQTFRSSTDDPISKELTVVVSSYLETCLQNIDNIRYYKGIYLVTLEVLNVWMKFMFLDNDQYRCEEEEKKQLSTIIWPLGQGFRMRTEEKAKVLTIIVSS